MNRASVGITLAVIACLSTSVQAQTPTPRERQLEEMVRKLNERIEKLEARIDQVSPDQSKATTERVEQLEKTVQQIQEDKPPAADSEEWKEIKKWVKSSTSLRPYWKDGLHLDNNDGSIKLKIGGRIQNDFSYFCDHDVEKHIGADFDEGTEFRRARLYIAGTIYNDIDFKAQYDFAGGDADFKDVYLGLKHVPFVGHLRVGQFKEPFSLEEQTSSNYITFLERSVVNMFAPGRNTGVMIHNTALDKRMTWALGFFRQTDAYGDGQGGRAYDATARITALPIYEDDGKKLLHVGLSYSKRYYSDDTLRFRERPEAHQAPRVVDTGNFPAEHGDFIGTELAYVDGPLSLQGEYVHSFINGHGHFYGDPNFYGASVQASYFLTGEHRPYKTSSGAFDRVRPLHNFREDGGWGAWEVAGRASYLHLNDRHIEGGRLINYSLGLNWYLNPSVRTMWNVIYGDPSKGGDFMALLWRFQVAF